MVGYAKNHTSYTYKLFNPETNRLIMISYVKWADWKKTNPAEILKMFRKAETEDLVPGIEEEFIPTSKPVLKMPVNVIPD